MEYIMKLTSRQTYKVVSFVLRNPVFSQTMIFSAVKVSWGRMNEVVQWLVSKGFVVRRGKSYELIDPAGLVSLFPLYRDMGSLLLEKLPLRLPKKQIIKRLPRGTVLCLDSALGLYSSYWRSGRVCVYAEKNSKQFKEILEEFKPLAGGNTVLWVFEPDIRPETVKTKSLPATDKLRTLIDLACDNKVYYARDLFKQLWNLRFEEE